MITLESLSTTDNIAAEIYELLKSGNYSTDTRSVLESILVKALGLRKPTPSHLKRNIYQWLSCATARKDVRPWLEDIHANGEWMVAADGHRLHAYKSSVKGKLPRAAKKSQKSPNVAPSDSNHADHLVSVFTSKLEQAERGELVQDIWQYITNVEPSNNGAIVGIPAHDKIFGYKYSYLYDASLGAHILNAYISADGVLMLDIDANTKAIIMPRIL